MPKICAAMLMRTILTSSLFLLLKLASGIDPTANSIQVTYQEVGPSAFATTFKITVQPVDLTDCKGNKVTFSVIAEGGVGAIHYRWKRKLPTETIFTSFGAKDSTKLPVYNIGERNEPPSGTQYLVEVSDQDTTLTSGIAVLTVNQITGIAPTGVASYTVNQGENLWFKVLTSGNTPSAYQWIKKYGSNDWRDLADNATISGSQREQLSLTKLLVADSGIYKLRVTFPTINGGQCVETSTITRKINVTPVEDHEPPVFRNLNNGSITFCPVDLEKADWDEARADILPVRVNHYQLSKYSKLFDLTTDHFSDNVTPSALLILHWGIYSTLPPFDPVLDEAGTPLDNRTGQISQHPENIDFDGGPSGSQTCQIIFWLEDGAGNLTPDSLRYKIGVIIPQRPEIISDF
ncbi:MAG: immunoglobulin domain-containing protein [Bacteroidetes bacterium]|nr:immunoglobulin domain-containing protein [Bacteroidota bacterium]